MYLNTIPKFVQTIFSDLVWSIPSKDEIFITFDDGPTAEGTDMILDILNAHQARATFFCLGQQVVQFKEQLNRIKQAGHSIGNHGYYHLEGWNTDNAVYMENVEKGSAVIDSKLYRPPYGKITLKQSRLIKTDYKIVMWNNMCGDFDASISKEKCLNNVISSVKAGDIIVLHDNEKSLEKVAYLLPKVLQHLKSNNLKTGIIE